jgi:hypothetical protein
MRVTIGKDMSTKPLLPPAIWLLIWMTLLVGGFGILHALGLLDL